VNGSYRAASYAVIFYYIQLKQGEFMRVVIFFSIMILFVFAIFTVIAKPDIIEKKYAELRAPIDRYFADKNNKIWQKEKESEHALWMLKLKLPRDCGSSKSSVRELECRNMFQQHADTFEQIWANKVSSGWKPAGASN
jgi:hypothetical protein